MSDITPAGTPPPQSAPMDTESPAPATREPTPPAPPPAAAAPTEVPADDTASKEATPIVVDSEASPAPAAPVAEEPEPAEPTQDEIEAEALKRKRKAVVADESKKRGRRMFGLLQSTLKQAKTAGENVSGAAAKRKELEERLASKLKGEREEMEKKGKVERETKELKLNVVKKEEEIGRTEAIYSVRHTTKLQLANFLCTSFTLPPPPPSTDGISVPFAPRLPHAMRVSNPSAPKPIYYRPYKLLRSQEDQIENQIAAVKSAIRKENEDWEDAKGEKIDGLEQAKRKRDAQLEERERDEREARQKKRREAEEKEDKERGVTAAASTGGDVEMRSKADIVKEVDADDVAMASAPVLEEDSPTNGTAKDEKMEGGEEDLEY